MVAASRRSMMPCSSASSTDYPAAARARAPTARLGPGCQRR
jgi:hypothetical protein